MSSGISGSYDGEGPNVGPATATTPGPTKQVSPDIGNQTNGLNNAASGGQGRQGLCRVDRRGRLRTSSESARAGVAINIGSGDQVLGVAGRALYIGTAGNLVVRMADDAADVTLSNLAAGVVYPFAIVVIRSAGSTAAGVILL